MGKEEGGREGSLKLGTGLWRGEVGKEGGRGGLGAGLWRGEVGKEGGREGNLKSSNWE